MAYLAWRQGPEESPCREEVVSVAHKLSSEEPEAGGLSCASGSLRAC